MARTDEVAVADDVAEAFTRMFDDIGPGTFALTGGGTARLCYERLAASGIDCSDTDVLISDERWVPIDHVDSNEGQARRAWLDHVPHGPISSLRGAGESRQEAAHAYDELVRSLGQIDLLHLGLGDDGHVASLFPGSESLAVRDRLVIPAGDDRHAWPRLTFTYPAIALAEVVVVTASGPAKRQAFRRVRERDPAMPATHINAPRVVWLVDPAAAG